MDLTAKRRIWVQTVSGGMTVFYGVLSAAWLMQSGPFFFMTLYFGAMAAAGAGLLFWRDGARRMMVALSGIGFVITAADALAGSRKADTLTMCLLVMYLTGWLFYRAGFLRGLFLSAGKSAGQGAVFNSGTKAGDDGDSNGCDS